jgi:hypothetical protein
MLLARADWIRKFAVDPRVVVCTLKVLDNYAENTSLV